MSEKYSNETLELKKTQSDFQILKTTIKNATHLGLYRTSTIVKNPAIYFAIIALAFNLILASTIFNLITNKAYLLDIANFESKTSTMTIKEAYTVKITKTDVKEQEYLMLDVIDKEYDLLAQFQLAEINISEYDRESNAFTNDTTSKIQWPFPVGVPISSGYGYRAKSCNYCSTNHKGLDFTPGLGAGVQAIADGVVVETINYPFTYMDTPEASYGTYVKIKHNVDGLEFESLYAHLMFGSVAVLAGDEVKVGDFIGQVGETGIVTGPHLHFEVRIDGEQLNPYPWLKEMNKKTSTASE